MYKLNQSTIKDTEDPFVCPRRLKAYTIDREYENEASKAMLLGCYFEYKATGALPKDGKVPVIQPLKNGKPPVVQARLDKQAVTFNEKLKEKGWRIISSGLTLSVRMEINGEEVELFGTLDQVVENTSKPGSRALMDTKMVANIHSDFGDFCWGDMHRYDKLQAKFYHLLWQELTGQDVPFLYAIFDHKPKPEHKFWPYKTTKEDHEEVFQRVTAAISRLRQWETEGYPEQPFYSECKRCQIEDCSMRVTEEPREHESVQLGNYNQSENGRPNLDAHQLVDL